MKFKTKLFVLSLSAIFVCFLFFFQGRLKLYRISSMTPLISQRSNESNFTSCLSDGQRALSSISLPWFITFGTALSYHRSYSFISHDIDIGVFIDDFSKVNGNDIKLLNTLRNYGFEVLFTYGNMSHGQQWVFLCPNSRLHFDIFVFYPGNLTNNETFSWWTATYNGLCNNMQHKKCRWRFSNFSLERFQMDGQEFYVVPKRFLAEQYGSDYMIPKKYGYLDSLKFLPNLIREYKTV